MPRKCANYKDNIVYGFALINVVNNHSQTAGVSNLISGFNDLIKPPDIKGNYAKIFQVDNTGCLVSISVCVSQFCKAFY